MNKYAPIPVDATTPEAKLHFRLWWMASHAILIWMWFIYTIVTWLAGWAGRNHMVTYLVGCSLATLIVFMYLMLRTTRYLFKHENTVMYNTSLLIWSGIAVADFIMSFGV